MPSKMGKIMAFLSGFLASGLSFHKSAAEAILKIDVDFNGTKDEK